MQLQAKGKLLITGEYFVLDGALALAVPSLFGQKMSIEDTPEINELSWESLNHKDESWFQASWSVVENEFDLLRESNGKEYLKILATYLPYIIPKQTETQVTVNEPRTEPSWFADVLEREDQKDSIDG